ncbi:MAG: response regulator transcription factor [Bacteroidota bacterium]
MITIGIAEDIRNLAEALRDKVQLDPELSVSWLAENGEVALQRLRAGEVVDLILMDIRMPLKNGIATTRELKQNWPDVAVVMSTVFDDEDHILEAILAGAEGYLMKDTPPARIHAAVREALSGGAPMSPLIAGKALQLIRKNDAAPKTSVPEQYNLTPREREILDLLIDGLSYQKIADQLFISYGTVRKHVENIYRKLEVHGKVEAIHKVSGGQ